MRKSLLSWRPQPKGSRKPEKRRFKRYGCFASAVCTGGSNPSMDCLIKKEYWINRQVQIYKKTPDAEVIRPWIWRFLNKRTSNRYNLLINTDKKQAHQMKFYQKYFTSCFNPRRILSRTRLGSTPSTSAISFTVIPR